MSITDLVAADRGLTATSLRLGIDVGGTAIKYAVVDVSDGALHGTIAQIPTPVPATPDAVATALERILAEVRGRGLPLDDTVVVAFPAVIRHGVALSAANISPDWLGCHVNEFLGQRLACPVVVTNDADAAGLAEVAHRAALYPENGPGDASVVLVLTLGTGIGSALVVAGHLVPNLELGHLEMGGAKAEASTSAVARERDGLDWQEYAQRLQQYLSHVEFLFSPDLVILGGGISVRHKEFLPHLTLRTRVVPALLANKAGVVGAALGAR